MSQKRMNEAKVVAVTVGVIAALIAVILIVLPERKQSPAEPETAPITAPQPVAPEPRPEPVAQPETVKEPVPELIEEAAAEDIDVGDVVDKVQGDVRPLTWKKPVMQSEPLYASPETFAQIMEVYKRYEANFMKTESISLRWERSLKAMPGAGELGLDRVATRGKADNQWIDVEARRSPMYLKMSGETGYGKTAAVVTAEGKRTTGRFEAESYLPMFIDGETGGVLAESTLPGCSAIRTNVTMDYELPGLARYVAETKRKGSTYDVITLGDPKDSNAPYFTEYYYNRETGLAEYFVVIRINPKAGMPRVRSAGARDYQKAGDIYYPRTFRSMSANFETQTDESWSNVVINGQKAE